MTSIRIVSVSLSCAALVTCGCMSATSGESGIYGWVGERPGHGYHPHSYSYALNTECMQIVNPVTWATIARVVCENGTYKVSLPPGQYVVVDPQGSSDVEVEPHRWLERNVIFD